MLAHQALVSGQCLQTTFSFFLTTLLRLTAITKLLVLKASVMHVDFGDGMVSYQDNGLFLHLEKQKQGGIQSSNDLQVPLPPPHLSVCQQKTVYKGANGDRMLAE